MATSFVAEILTSAGQLEKEEILTKLSRLNKRVGEMKLEVYELTRGKYKDFLPSLASAEDLAEKVQNLSGEMQSVSDTIEQEIKSQLNMSTGEFQTLSLQLQETNATLAVTERLMKLNEMLNVVKKATREEEFSTAASSLLNVHTLLSFSVTDGEKEILVLQALDTEYKVLKEKFIFDLGEFWAARVVWKVPEDRTGVKVGSGPVEVNLMQTVRGKAAVEEAARAMEKMNILDNKLAMFGEKLVTYIIKPIVSDCSVNVEYGLSRTEKKLKLQAKKKIPEQKETPQPTEAFAKLEKVFDFFYEHVLCLSAESVADQSHGEKDITMMEKLGSIIAEKVIELIVKDCLSHAIPCNKAELENFRDVVGLTEKFQNKLSSLHFITANNTGLIEYVQNVNVLFANKKCREILVNARNLMTSEIHNTVVISPEKPIGELPPLDPEAPALKRQKVAEKLALDSQLSENTFRLPVCHISASIQSMMSLAYETLQEAVDSSPQCAIQLFYAVRNIFELFCSVFPTYHKQSLVTLPQLAAIHHNNCFFIAHHLMTLGHQFSRKLPSPLHEGAATFVDLVQKVRKIGTDCFMEQMTTQKGQLLEFIQGAQGFSNIAEEGNCMCAQKAIKQVLHQLRHLQRIWQEVLPPNIYSKAIGTLVNTVVMEIINSLVVVEDISADDGKHLHSLLSELGTNVAPLFDRKDGSETFNPEVELQKNVQKWRKFKELILLLNAGLQEIGDRWADGKGPLAVEFTSNEVKQLVRALFQNTDRRAAVLAKIH